MDHDLKHEVMYWRDAANFALQKLVRFPLAVYSPAGQPIREIATFAFTAYEPDPQPYSDDAAVMSASVHEFAMHDCGEQETGGYGYWIFSRESIGSKRAKHRKLTPWQWAMHSLKADQFTRQAIVQFDLPIHYWFGPESPPAPSHGVFTIRGGCLDFAMVFREADAIGDLVYGTPWYCSLLDRALVDLRSHYPALVKRSYTAFYHSLTLQEGDVPLAERLITDGGN